jgi:hypothetical protein
MERFNLKKLNDVAVKEQYQVVISDRFAALENFSDGGGGGGGGGGGDNIRRAWNIIRENMKSSATESISYYEMKQHKPWFDEECLELLD